MHDIHGTPSTIPKRIHQTWKTDDIPEPKEWPASWIAKNPDWDYTLWTDADLLKLVQDHYPHLETLFQSYPNPVQRADVGRYLVLDHCGGVYADLDTECLSSLDPIADETRVVLAREPNEHAHHATVLGMDHLMFNGVMASPKGHPFWRHMIAMLPRCEHAKQHVLESTGPLLLTAAVETFDEPDSISLNSCHIFNPLTVTGRRSTARVWGDYAGHHFCNHYWSSTWFEPAKGSLSKRVKRSFRKARYKRTRGAFLPLADINKTIDKSILHQPINVQDRNVCILIPVRDAEPFLDQCFALLLALDYPKDRMKVVFCEGDSVDGTKVKLRSLAAAQEGTFREIQIIHCDTGEPLDRDRRWLNEVQFRRRANLAKVRNHLINHGLSEDDHWALWIDADVCDYDPSILNRLLREQTKVVTPDCVFEWGGPSYDLNAFVEDTAVRDHRYYKHMHRGLFMPPANYEYRRHLHVLRCLDRVPLSSVGGTMLLVHAAVHRAGVRFPEIPYDHLLETEGFGRLCQDLGVTPIGLPNVQIKHVRS